jgi:hypothetical protein
MVSIINELSKIANGFSNAIERTFFFFEKFVLNIELGIYSITFILLTLLFFASILMMLSGPAWIVNKLNENKTGIAKFFNNFKKKSKGIIEKIA